MMSRARPCRGRFGPAARGVLPPLLSAAGLMVLLSVLSTFPPAGTLSHEDRRSVSEAHVAMTRPLGGSQVEREPPIRATTPNATDNLTAALSRAVIIAGLAAGAVVTLVWCRVALSWFSHDASKKIQAKERARDALIGSLVLVAAVSGLAWGLVRYVLTGS